MRIYGLVKVINKQKRIYGVKTFSRIYYIYFKRSLYQTFKNYLNENNLIDLEVMEPKMQGKYFAYPVYYISKIKSLLLNKLYFSEENNNLSLKHLFKSIRNVLILDLEMTMPPFNYKGSYEPTIIEMGYVLYDDKGNMKLNYNEYLKTDQELSNRTINFLKLKPRDYYKNAVTFYKSYNELKRNLRKYKPTLIVYGKNDILILKKAFAKYNLPNILNYIRVINLASLIENYYHHKNEVGLFNLYNAYYKTDLKQTHDALDDAKITYEVYKAFKKDILLEIKTI